LQSSVDLNASSSAGTREIKVLQVSTEPIFNLGGVGLIVLRIIKGLPPSYRVDVACPDANSNNLPAEVRERIDELIAIPGQKWSAADKHEFVRRVREGNYDLIHFHGGTFSFDAHLPWRSPLYPLSRLGIPWVYSNHCAPAFTTGLFREGYPLPLKMLKATVAYFSLAWLMTLCPRQIFDSRENQERIAKYYPWAARKFMTLYHSGLEGEPPRPAVRDTAITIGNLGHIGWRKGQFDLLEAFCLLLPRFPQLELLLVGPEDSGDCARRIKAEIAKRNLQGRVSMPGGLTDLRPFWDKVDIYVQPSHFEGAPMSLMEAVWHGKPAVGTRVSGIPEIVEHDANGLLVEAKNPAALAAALERLIPDLELRRRFAAAGSRHILAKGMTRPQMVNRHLEVYTELLSTRHART
jgi:glycosyltransferase involved in cell wall biosynthesis